MKSRFRKHFGIALGYAGWVRAARIAWMLSRSADTSLHGKADCSGGIPCATCPDIGGCGQSGCVRQVEHCAPPPARDPFSFGGDLGKTVQLIIRLEQVNAVQWSATSNHSARIVRHADAHDALRLALTDAGARSGEVPPVDCYIGWARLTERSMVFCDSDAPGAFRVYRARAVDGAQPPQEQSLTDEALRIADAAMWEQFLSHMHGDKDNCYAFAFPGPDDMDNDPAHEAVRWLQRRGYVMLEQDEAGDYARVVQEPGSVILGVTGMDTSASDGTKDQP